MVDTVTDAPVENAIPVAGTPEYEAYMAKVGENAVTGNQAPAEEAPAEIPAKPDWVEDKFYNKETGEVNYEALAKGYQELQRKQSTKEATPPKETPPKEKDGEAPSQEAIDTAVDKAGLSMVDLQSEYAETGEVSEASLEALAKAGIPKETVDAYIAGQEALVSQIRTQSFGIVGGEENYKAMMDWADVTLTPAEKAEFNEVVNRIKSSSRETMIRGLYNRYTEENGTTGNLVQGKSTSQSGVSGYASKAEMMTAMGDPRYKSDSAYRDAVVAKVGLSNF